MVRESISLITSRPFVESYCKYRIRPIIYCVAIAEKITQGRFLIRNWRNAQITDVAPFVRHLLVTSRSYATELLSTVTLQNVENLAIWGDPFSRPEDLKKMNDFPLRMLSVGLKHITLDEAINRCPALRNVTHLEMTFLRGSTWNDCKALVEFPNLTHLCFDSRELKVEDEAILGLLKHCPSLRAMVRQLGSDIDECTIEDDPRFLVLWGRMVLEDFIVEWERSANGQIGLWELVDIIIEARKSEAHSFSTCCFSWGFR